MMVACNVLKIQAHTTETIPVENQFGSDPCHGVSTMTRIWLKDVTQWAAQERKSIWGGWQTQNFHPGDRCLCHV